MNFLRLAVWVAFTLVHSIGAASPLAAAHNNPDPCERFGRLFSTAVGIGAGLAGRSKKGSFKQDTLVHTRVLTDCGH